MVSRLLIELDGWVLQGALPLADNLDAFFEVVVVMTGMNVYAKALICCAFQSFRVQSDTLRIWIWSVFTIVSVLANAPEAVGQSQFSLFASPGFRSK